MDLNALIDGLAQNSHEAGQSACGNVANMLGQSLAGFAAQYSAAQNAGTAMQNMGSQYGSGIANVPVLGHGQNITLTRSKTARCSMTGHSVP